MNASKVSEWIKCLGQDYETLLSNDIIPPDELIELFPGIDELYLEPDIGVSMSFREETLRFESLFITLIKTTPSTVEYKGEVPVPYRLEMTQSYVRALFGEPLESSGPIRMPEPMGQTGGWDSYRLDPVVYPNKTVMFQYTASMQVDTLVFTLIDTGHS